MKIEGSNTMIKLSILIKGILDYNKLLIVVVLLLFSCNQFEYCPYQISPEDEYHDLNQRNIDRITTSNSDTLKIAIIGDSQRFYTSTSIIVDKINKIPDINFIIHTGDLVDFGIQREYTWMHELLSELNQPYIAVVGNHDLIGNGGEIYKLMYGEFNFSFYVNGNKFIYLNTNGREFNFTDNVPDLDWLDSELSDTATYENAIIVSHIDHLNVDYNPELRDDFLAVVNNYDKVRLCINGHNHDYTYNPPNNEGVAFLNSYSTTKEKFVLLKLWNNNFSIETVE